MLTIPAIDIYENKVARLTRGDFNQVTFYEESPATLAKKYESKGFQWLHLVDLMASKTGKINVIPTIQEIKNTTNLEIEFGGGIRNYDQVAELIKIGVDKIIIGSISVTDKNEFEKILIRTIDPDKFIVAIDSDFETIFTKGWTENSGISLYDHIDYCTSLGITTFLCTDISKDGTLSGPSHGLYQNIMKKYPKIKLVASGGVGSLHDIIKLATIDLYAVVVGKAIYEKKIRLEDLISFGK
jgi:phosphoribosylformimino-5-aminoimidazole carboxamide ribotide isomerase